MKSYKNFLNERKTIQVKRKYGEYAPTNVGANAPVRQRILGFVSKKGSCCKNDLVEFIKSANEETGRSTNTQWIKKNMKYLTTFEQDGETHYKLSKLGKRVIKATTVNESTNDYVEEIGDLEELIYDKGNMKVTNAWEDEAEDLLQGKDTWGELDEPDLTHAIDMARSFMKKHKIKESLIIEGVTPTFKALMKRAKALGIETVSELEDLISNEFDESEPYITGADFEIAKKKLRLEESKADKL
jgi:hypothetical protein